MTYDGGTNAADEADPELSAFLGRARAGLAPSPAAAASVRAAVNAAVLLAPSGAEHGAARHGDARNSSRAPLATSASMSPLFAKLAAVAVFGAATGVGGYMLGYRVGLGEQARQAEPVAVIPIPAVIPNPTVAPSVATVTAPAPGPRALPHTRSAPALPVAAPPSAPLTAPPSVLAPAPSSPVAAASAESPLEIEARLLGRVERALRDSNPRFALGLLGELDREVPGGQLGEEREAARVMAYCALGTSSAAQRASDFMSRHPNSAYAVRIADACANAEHGEASE